MPNSRRDRPSIRQKCSKACERCRLLKVKCSGTQPCLRCRRRSEPCQFALVERRVKVSESYLRELQSRRSDLTTPPDHDFHEGTTSRLQRSPPASAPHPTNQSLPDVDVDSAVRHGGRHTSDAAANLMPSPTTAPHPRHPEQQEPPGSVEPGFGQNPLADNDYTFAAAAERYWYMGPTSTWSFCRRVLALLGKRIPEAAPDPWHRPDKGAFPMQWIPLRSDEVPDVGNLPPLDYALLLLSTAKFYLADLFAMIDENEFTQNVYELYERPAEKANSSRVWYAQFLLILAYGKAFPVSNRGRGPPGCQYALTAMTMLPDMSGLYPDPVLAIQTLALAALYFQSVDMRVAAYYHISHALRTCVIEGMHRYMPEQVVGIEYSKRCNMAFWVIYILDREFSSLIGAPSSLRDEDITAHSPSQMDESIDALNMTFHVRLSRMTARILTTVYGVGRQFDGSLIPNTQSILRDLAKLSQDLTDLLNTPFQGSVTKASRMSQRLMISYHHCVVLSTRPLVMCALQMHVENTDMQLVQAIPLTPTVASLLYSCVDSAQTVVRMLRVLGEEDLLDAFLPFQLDAAYSSAFILHLIRLISPSLLHDDSWSNDIKYVLDRMISDGSLVAPLRKVELGQLEHIMSALSPAADQSWGLTPAAVNLPPENTYEPSFSEDVLGDRFWDIFVTNGVSGIPPQELLDLADRLDEYIPVPTDS